MVDEEGYLSIVDRTKDMIVTGGVNVYPREIEELIAADHRVAEVAVVGLPDAKWGESITAFVVARRGFDLDFDSLSAEAEDPAGGLQGAADLAPGGGAAAQHAGKILKRELRAGIHAARSRGDRPAH